jgi:hypothetical protein
MAAESVDYFFHAESGGTAVVSSISPPSVSVSSTGTFVDVRSGVLLVVVLGVTVVVVRGAGVLLVVVVGFAVVVVDVGGAVVRGGGSGLGGRRVMMV